MMFLNCQFIKTSIFFLCRRFARPKCWGISIKNSKFIEPFILRCLLIICVNKTSKILNLKLAADLMKVSSIDILEMFNSISNVFRDMLRVSKIVSLKSWSYFGFGIKAKRSLSSSTKELTFEQPSPVVWISQLLLQAGPF